MCPADGCHEKVLFVKRLSRHKVQCAHWIYSTIRLTKRRISCARWATEIAQRDSGKPNF